MVALTDSCVLIPTEGQTFLRSHTLAKALTRKRSKARNKRTKRPPLSIRDYERLANKVLPVTCSRPWQDHCVSEADACGILPTSTNVPRALGSLGIYPPPADRTPMKRCRCDQCTRRGARGEVLCQRLWPAHYINSRGYSYECALEHSSLAFLVSLPSSPGIINMARLKVTRRRGSPTP